MFGTVRLIFAVLLISGVAGAGVYVMKLRADKRDVGKLAIAKTKAIERIVNKGADNAARCVELASGAEHTEAELKATKKSEINPECPSLANPNYVAYE
jgi:CHASE1-domain containing sensor protein